MACVKFHILFSYLLSTVASKISNFLNTKQTAVTTTDIDICLQV